MLPEITSKTLSHWTWENKLQSSGTLCKHMWSFIISSISQVPSSVWSELQNLLWISDIAGSDFFWEAKQNNWTEATIQCRQSWYKVFVHLILEVYFVFSIQQLLLTKIPSNIACMQAVLGARKKSEFVMRSPSWIRPARSGSGWGTKRAPSPRSLCQP